MKHFRLLSAVYLLFIVWASCKPAPDYSRDIEKLDGSLAELAYVHNAWSTLDTTALLGLVSKTDTALAPVAEKLKTDTLQKTHALFLADCYETKQHLSQAIAKRGYYTEALAGVRKRIENLEHDLMNNLIEENKAREYIVNELKAMQALTDQARNDHSNMLTSASILDSLESRIIAFADTLAAQK